MTLHFLNDIVNAKIDNYIIIASLKSELTCNRVPTSSGNHGKPGKLLKKSSMHGKSWNLTPPPPPPNKHINMEKSWNFVK